MRTKLSKFQLGSQDGMSNLRRQQLEKRTGDDDELNPEKIGKSEYSRTYRDIKARGGKPLSKDGCDELLGISIASVKATLTIHGGHTRAQLMRFCRQGLKSSGHIASLQKLSKVGLLRKLACRYASNDMRKAFSKGMQTLGSGPNAADRAAEKSRPDG